MFGGICRGLNKRMEVLLVGLRVMSLEKASVAAAEEESSVGCSVVAGSVGTWRCLVSEPSGLREIWRSLYGSTEQVLSSIVGCLKIERARGCFVEGLFQVSN